jgi:hypothetical protein
MTVSASKVSTLCSSSEIALVQASRQPELNRLTAPELKRLTLRARKLSGKSQSVARGQARTKSRRVGSGSVAARSLLRIQVFSDALQSLERRLSQLEHLPAPAAAGPRPTTKKVRNASHRATRAKVRKKLAGHKAAD